MISDLVKENDYLKGNPQEPQDNEGLKITRLNYSNLNKPAIASYLTTPTARSENEDDHLTRSKSSAGTYTPKTDGMFNTPKTSGMFNTPKTSGMFDTPKADSVDNFLDGEG